MRRFRSMLATLLALSLLGTSPAFALAPTSQIERVQFASPDVGYLSGGYLGGSGSVGFVSRTADGGLTWAAKTFDGEWMSTVSGVGAFADPMSLWTLSSNRVWGTTDGGSAWNPLGEIKPFLATPDVADLRPLSATDAIAVGRQVSVYQNGNSYGDVAAIWRTSNGGASWSPVLMGPYYAPDAEGYIPQTDAGLFAMGGTPSNMFAVGKEYASDAGTQERVLMYRSTNSGSSWVTETVPATATVVSCVAAKTAGGGWAAGFNKVLKRSSGAWNLVSSPSNFSPTIEINSIDTLDDATAIVVGDSGRIAFTSNGGSSWTTATAPLSSLAFQSVSFRDRQNAFAVGDNQAIAMISIAPDGTLSVREANAANGAYSDKTAPLTSASGIPATWTNQDVTFSLSATDGWSGVKGTTYRIGAGTGLSYSAPVTVSTQGSQTLYFNSVDNASNTETSKTATIRIDRTAPVTTSDAKAIYYGSGTVRFTSNDSGLSGVKATKWRLEGGAWQTGTTMTTTVPGSHVLDFYSEDNAGNVETYKTANFDVIDGVPDTTPPTTVASGIPTGWSNTSVDVTLEAADNEGGAGLKSVYYTLDGVKNDYTGSFTVSAAGQHTLTYWAVDNAGNAETATSAMVRIDKAAPVSVLSGVPSGWSKQDVLAKISASDGAGSGVASQKYRLDGSADADYPQAGIAVSKEGTSTLEYWAQDVAGNSEDVRQATVRIDKTAPVTTSDARADYTTSATIKLTPSDALSGVSKTEYQIDGGVWKLGTTASISTIGAHTIAFRSTDVAGNIETGHLAKFSVRKSTSLSFKSLDSTPVYKKAQFTGKLYGVTAATPLRVEYSYNNSSWAYLRTVYTASTGSYSFTDTSKATRRIYYRVRFTGSATHNATGWASTSVLPNVYLTRKSSWDTLRYGRTYTAWGYVAPRHYSTDATIKLRLEKYYSGSYHYVKMIGGGKYSYYSTTMTKYSVPVKLPRGKWRVRAYHYSDSLNSGTYGSSDVFYVK